MGVLGMNNRNCLWCGAELQQRKDEPLCNFNNRKYCDKSHASLHTNEHRKPTKRHITNFMSPLTI